MMEFGLSPAACRQIGALILGTFASEDLTCIGTGLFIRQQRLDWLVGVAGCFLGIYLGDLGLWLIGRGLGRRVVQWRPVRKRLSAERIDHFASWFDRNGGAAVLAARFMPGTRLPLYVAAGAVGKRPWRFAWWTFVAAAIWTPLLVLLVALLGDPVVRPLTRFLGGGWVALAAAILLLFVGIRVTTLAVAPSGRARIVASVSRIWRWEFWPTWIFYIPLVPWIAYLAIRHRGLMTPTAANPGIPDGGVVGESKYDILTKLPSEWVVPSELIPPGDADSRVAQFQEVMQTRGWDFPIVLKPDAGQRGAGVKLMRDIDRVREYLGSQPHAVLAQQFHPGPFEAGVFYYRIPGEARGHIFSMTDKHFPVLTGDGRSTVEALIWRHPRFRMQATTFLARMNGDSTRVLGQGERLKLANAGNHCQGTMFCDGSHLITPALERAIDAIAQQFDGFFFGRFDIRYRDKESFKAGHDISIIELNGVTSESTNIYDPGWSILRAYRMLIRQWAILFEIGARNRRRGQAASSLWRLISEARMFYARRSADLLAD